MIDQAKYNLTFLFTTVILAFNLAVIIVVGYSLRENLMESQRQRLVQEITFEFRPFYEANDLAAVDTLDHAVHFMLYNRNGKVVGATLNSRNFRPEINSELLNRGFEGETLFEVSEVKGHPYMIAYFHLDDYYTGLAAANMNLMELQQKNYMISALIFLPGLVVLSFLVSRFLVHRALKPVADLHSLQQTFAENLAHELMSPLTSLKGAQEVALRHDRDSGEYREVLQENMQEINRLIDLLDGLESLGSGRYGKGDLKIEQGDLLTLTRDNFRPYLPTLKKRNISHLFLGDESLVCNMDSSLMGQALKNLIDNAVKFTPKGGWIKVHAWSDGRRVEIRMENKSHQIEIMDAQALLEPFVRGKNVSVVQSDKGRADPSGGPHRALEKIPGKGLGLHLTHHILRAHGGGLEVSFSSEEVFEACIWLPRERRPIFGPRLP